jgi:hypothetical protein
VNAKAAVRRRVSETFGRKTARERNMICNIGPLVAVGLAALAMGINALRTGRIPLTATKELAGASAKFLGWVVIVVGIGIILLGAGGLPFLIASGTRR